MVTKEKRKEYNTKWKLDNPDKYLENKRIFNKQYNKKYPKRRTFTSRVSKLVRTGRLIKTPCHRCGGMDNLEACSFTDAENPTWFCNSCHRLVHEKIRELLEKKKE